MVSCPSNFGVDAVSSGGWNRWGSLSILSFQTRGDEPCHLPCHFPQLRLPFLAEFHDLPVLVPLLLLLLLMVPPPSKVFLLSKLHKFSLFCPFVEIVLPVYFSCLPGEEGARLGPLRIPVCQ